MTIPIFCDVCGDITVAWKPLEVRFPDGSILVINVCLQCYTDLEKSRKFKVAQIIKTIFSVGGGRK